MRSAGGAAVVEWRRSQRRRWGSRLGGRGYQGGKCRWVTYHIITLETEPNDPLAYAPGTKLHRPIMSMLGVNGGRLDTYIYLYIYIYIYIYTFLAIMRK